MCFPLNSIQNKYHLCVANPVRFYCNLRYICCHSLNLPSVCHCLANIQLEIYRWLTSVVGFRCGSLDIATLLLIFIVNTIVAKTLSEDLFPVMSVNTVCFTHTKGDLLHNIEDQHFVTYLIIKNCVVPRFCPCAWGHT